METVAFPRGYDLPDITIEDVTGVNAVSTEETISKNGKFIKSNRIIIKKGDKQFNAAGQQM